MTNLVRHIIKANGGGLPAVWKSAELQRIMKNTEQGAATQIYAAISSEWESTGGKYLDDCGVAPPHSKHMIDEMVHGHSADGYNVGEAKLLWDESCGMNTQHNRTTQYKYLSCHTIEIVFSS